jgi:hypothetical protein
MIIIIMYHHIREDSNLNTRYCEDVWSLYICVYCSGSRGLNQQCKGSSASSYLSPYATSSTAFSSSSGSSSHHSGQSGASTGPTASYASYGAGYNCTASTATGFAGGSQGFPSSQQVYISWHICYMLYYGLLLRRRFGLVIGYVNNLHVITTNCYLHYVYCWFTQFTITPH